ncbi:MAG: hypothetical protein PF437_07095, partial [Sulfurimonas sp.]|nr:hypothetical protein [Sulfurimonas sp.]
GCGNGRSFLYPLKEIGFKNLHGCDPNLSESILYPNGLQITSSAIFDIEGKWDIMAKVSVGNLQRFYNVKADTRKKETSEY